MKSHIATLEYWDKKEQGLVALSVSWFPEELNECSLFHTACVEVAIFKKNPHGRTVPDKDHRFIILAAR
jgi:hypothetical protein